MSAVVFIRMIIGIMLFAFVFIALNYASRDIIIDYGLNNTNDTEGRNTITFIDNAWAALPIAFVIAMMYYGITRSQKREII